MTVTLSELVADRLSGMRPYQLTGRISRLVGLEAEAVGVRAVVGEVVRIDSGTLSLQAEVVAVRDEVVQLAPLGTLEGIGPGATVTPTGTRLSVTVGPGLTGRVLDALGDPLDDGPPIIGERVPIIASSPNPLSRRRIDTVLPLGVRVVDTMLTCAAGQRVGIFAGSGVGKSTTLGMMARGTSADVVVIALIGERGREVREFLEDELGEEGRERAVTVVATADAPPMLRMKAAHTATRIAEWFRDQGLNVLLMMDSLTRFAYAAREVGLAAGEPPATRGYPPSVPAELARLLERAGPGVRGTITGLYTVLVEGDDTVSDPVADNARSILDGHIVLSRRLAAAGHYPTVDVLESASRLAAKVTTSEQRALAGKARALMAAYAETRDLIEIGAYVQGTNPVVDEALERRADLEAVMRQDVSEVAAASDSWSRLAQALS